MHKSQAMAHCWHALVEPTTHLLMDGSVTAVPGEESSLFDGIDTTIPGLTTFVFGTPPASWRRASAR